MIDSRSVVVGGSVSLDCPATGVPEPDVEWTRRDDALSVVSQPSLRLVDGGRRLQLLNAHLHDAGAYTCNATNAAGTASKQFVIDVIGEFVLLATYLSVKYRYTYKYIHNICSYSRSHYCNTVNLSLLHVYIL